MRDCVFLVADNQMAAMVEGFLTRDQCHLSLGCGPFDFDAGSDIVVDPNRDPGVYSRGHELLAQYASSHQRAVVMLDAAWEGAPGPAEIQAKISQDLAARWGTCLVVVLEPELEAWIWQDNQHVAEALGMGDYAALRAELEAADFWRAGEPKPYKPKEAVERVLYQARIPRSSAIYRKIASRASTKHCVDPAFLTLRDGLSGWFGASA